MENDVMETLTLPFIMVKPLEIIQRLEN